MTSARFTAQALSLALTSSLLAQPQSPPTEAQEAQDASERISLPGITRVLVRTEKLVSGSKIRVKNRNGDIWVVGWEKEEMRLTAEIRDTDRRKVELVISQQDGDLDIETVFQHPFWSFNWGLVQSPRCEVTIFVPHWILGYFRTTNGSIFISYLDGYAHCETNNGDIQVKHFSGEVHVETKNGTIEGLDLQARIQALTANGQVILTGVDGGIVAETINGNIIAKALNGWGEGISLSSTNGSIDIALGEATGELTAASSDGDLDIKIPHAKVIEISKRSAHLQVPGSMQKINLHTINGTIVVRE
jgi:DUF4097 and DUF4098 domain-containing protein YvlB